MSTVSASAGPGPTAHDEPPGLAARELARAVVTLVQDRGGPQARGLTAAVTALAGGYPRELEAPPEDVRPASAASLHADGDAIATFALELCRKAEAGGERRGFMLVYSRASDGETTKYSNIPEDVQRLILTRWLAAPPPPFTWVPTPKTGLS